jgi:hypothetical protein
MLGTHHSTLPAHRASQRPAVSTTALLLGAHVRQQRVASLTVSQGLLVRAQSLGTA